MTQLTINDLPETLQKLFLEVEQTNIPLTITHEGKPLVVIHPAKKRKPRPPFGFMKGKGEILGDTIAPIEHPLTHEIAILSRKVACPHQDPADRFIAATVIHYNLQLATVDQNLISTTFLRTIS